MQKENKKIQSYVFYPIDSCMYIWQEEDSVVIIDPCVSKDALLYLRKRRENTRAYTEYGYSAVLLRGRRNI